MKKKILFFLLKVFASGSVLYLLSHKISFRLSFDNIRSVSLPMWAVLILFYLISVFLAAVRWRTMYSDGISLYESIKFTFIGILFSTVLPGAVFGDILKGVSLSVTSKSKQTSLLIFSISADKFISLFILLIFFLLGSGFVFHYYPDLDFNVLINNKFITIAVCILLFLVIIALVYSSRLRYTQHYKRFSQGRLLNILTALKKFFSITATKKKDLLKCATLAVAFHLLNIFQNYIILRALGYIIPFMPLFVLYVVLSIILVLPFTIAGIGVRDLAALSLYTPLGIPNHGAVAFSMMLLMLSLLGALGGGVFFFIMTFQKYKIKNP